MFNIDFQYIIRILIPVRLRKLRLISFMEVITSFVKQIYDEFVIYRVQMLYDINFTGQLCYLQKKLQDTFAIPGLFISDGFVVELTYLSQKSEGNLPVFINNSSESENVFYLSNYSEFIASSDFVVNIPEADYDLMTIDDFNKMNAIINYYLVFGKTYNLNKWIS